MYKRSLLFMLFILLAGQPAVFSQKQVKADRYKSRTLADVIDLNREGTDQILKKSKLEDQQGFIGIEPFYSKTTVQYIGSPRPISTEHQGLINHWTKLQRVDKNFVNLYEKECLFKEGETEYWIPVQKELEKSLSETVRSGEFVNLFVIYVGAEKARNMPTFSSLFLATAFEK